MRERQAVITGVGAITPLGRTYRETMDAAWRGEIAISNQQAWLAQQTQPEWLVKFHEAIEEAAAGADPAVQALLLGVEQENGSFKGGIKNMIPGYQRIRVKVAGKIVDYNLLEDSDYPFADLIPARSLPREFSPSGIIGLRAAAEAGTHANILDDRLRPLVDPSRYAIIIGSGIGGAVMLAEGAYKLIQNIRPAATDLFQLMPESPVIAIADVLGAEGGHSLHTQACNSSVAALAQAIRRIKLGEIDVALAGGTEALSYYTVAEFEATHAAYEGDDPWRASLPFNPARQGAVISEGATIFTVEEEEHAKRRGATILARLTGYGEAGGPGERIELSDRHLIWAAKLALQGSGWDPGKSFVYDAHATSTKKGDPGEIRVVNYLHHKMKVNLKKRVTATKGRRAHELGAAGAAASGEMLEAIQTQSLPPAVGSEEVDPGMERFMSDAYGVTECRIDGAIIAGAGFGNQNGVLILERYED